MRTKFSLFTLLSFFSFLISTAQVGINNTNPQAALDITASATPAATDGILIPRVDEFPTGVTTAQDGMLVFITGNSTPTKGFYYYNHTITSWTSIQGAGGGTLDQAYDFGGAGAGNTIAATDGAVTINGEDGILVSGIFGAGETITTTGAGTRMFFNPRKSAFRAGQVIASEWNDANIGERSTAFGFRTIASGDRSTAFGSNTTASGLAATSFGLNNEASGIGATTFGDNTLASGVNSIAFGFNTIASGERSIAFGVGTTASGTNTVAFGASTIASGTGATAFGIQTEASSAGTTAFGSLSTASGLYATAFGVSSNATSYAETTIGSYATTYTPLSTLSFNSNDRLFTVGNGQFISGVVNRSNALTIYKSGLMNINDAYNMPLTDGTAGQVMTSDGAGNVTFQSAAIDTDNQQIDILNLNGTDLEISLQDDGVATQTIDLSSLQDGSGGTLDEAYDFGGAGNGNTITATDGAVTIDGEDGILVTGTFGTGATIGTPGAGTRMFFNPSKSAFRAGTVIGTQWDDANIGEYSASFGLLSNASGDYATSFGYDAFAGGNISFAAGGAVIASGNSAVALGNNAVASGLISTAFGDGTRASGIRSTAFGVGTFASGTNSIAFGVDTFASGTNSTSFGFGNSSVSYGETTLGIFATTYTPIDTNNFNASDRLFAIGNGTTSLNRSNALTIYKSGLMNINDEYNMPLTDGMANQVMTTDGAGNVTFQDINSDNDWQEVGTDIERQTGDVYIGDIATTNNKLVVSGVIEDWDNSNYILDPNESSRVNNVTFDSGTAASPTINFQGNVTTGFFSPIINEVSITTAGTERFRFTNKSQLEFPNAGNSVFIGNNAGENDDLNNNRNVFIGENAGRNNNDGSNNIYTGFNAGLNTVSGSNNIAMGSLALRDNVTGVNNIAIGWQTNSEGTGSRNVIIGDNSGLKLGTGNDNVMIGATAGNRDELTSSRNVYIGRYAGGGDTNNNMPPYYEKSGNVFLGNEAGRYQTASNRLFIENTDADENNALIYGEFGTDNTTLGNLLRTNSEFQIGNPTTTGYRFPITDGTLGQVMTTDGTGNITFEDLPTFVDTDNQQIDLLNLNGTNLEISLEDDGVATQTLDLSSLQDGSGGTLDQAYDFGGTGAGNTITATDGAVTINGEDGILVTGTAGSGDGIIITGAGTRMFFNPNKSAFRAGRVPSSALDNSNWNEANVGNHSVAFGLGTLASGTGATAYGEYADATGFVSLAHGTGTLASGSGATAFGNSTTASGETSTAWGFNNQATGLQATAFGSNNVASQIGATVWGLGNTSPSSRETTLGQYASNYTPVSPTSFNINDRLFTIGNGQISGGVITRGNALTIYKSGLMNINDAYNMPLADGTAGQAMITDGAGNVTFQNTGGTLDDAYDQGGAGAGRTINVDNGAVVIQGNAGGSTATTSAQLILTETQANDFSRIRLTNSVETDNIWTIATRTDNDAATSRMNFNHTGVGDLFQLWGDGFVEVNGKLEVDGQVGININNPGQALVLPNTADNGLGGTVAQNWGTYSDNRLKSNQQQLEHGLDKIKQLQPKTYFHHNSTFNNDGLELAEAGENTLGFIAQELYEVLPEAVNKPQDENTQLWSVDYNKVIPVAVKAIQELNEKVDTLVIENKTLKQKLDKLEQLEARLLTLENYNNASEALNKIED